MKDLIKFSLEKVEMFRKISRKYVIFFFSISDDIL